MILSASAILGIVAALMTTLPPSRWFLEPTLFVSAYSDHGSVGRHVGGVQRSLRSL